MFAIRINSSAGVRYVHLDDYTEIRYTDDLHSAYIDTRDAINERVAEIAEVISSYAADGVIEIVGVSMAITSVEKATATINYPGKFVLQDPESGKYYEGNHTDIWYCEIEPDAHTTFGATRFDTTAQAEATILEMIEVAGTDNNWFDPATYMIVAL